MSKESRFDWQYRDNASQLHIAIGEALRQGSFSAYRIYQEYPVYRILPSYTNRRHRYDWVVLDLKLVIEGQGIQHTKPVGFSKASNEDIQNKYFRIQQNDRSKREAAIKAGYTYIEVPYKDKEIISDKYLLNLYKIYFNPEKPPEDKQKKEKQKAYWKEQYRRYKLYKKEKRTM